MIESTEPEFRRDPVTGRWVIVAPERSLRPMTLAGAEPAHRPDAEGRPCPFCPGQEFDTPNEVYAVRAPGTLPDGPGWQLRVVPNKFPAVKPRTDTSRLHNAPRYPEDGSLFESISGFGRHEVVIESADHISNPALLPDERLRDVFLSYRGRLIALSADPALRYAAVFKNVGAEAGASLGHCHSQILATPLVPEIVRQELAGAKEYYSRSGWCVFCDIVRNELADGRRVVAETAHCLAATAFAGRFAYEVWVMPKAHASRYELSEDSLLDELAGLMRRVVKALDSVLSGPAYNWFLHTAPLRSADLPHYHWHFEVMPRTSRPAGFEWGTGCFVNAVAPETAAAELRRALR